MASSEQGQVVSALKEIFAGTCAGIIGKVIEYPLDTVKVRMQIAGAESAGALAIVRQVISEKGIRGLYKGVGSPISGAMAENATLFVAYGRTNAWLHPEGGDVPLPITLFSGGVAGFFVSKVLTPVEMQAQTDGHAQQRYRSTWNCFTTTLREEGLVKGLYKGHSAMLLREVPGNVAWFGAYEMFCRLLTPPGKTKDDLPPYYIAAAGAMGGIAYWSAFFPADVVKSKMQTGALPEGVSSFAQTFKWLHRKEGLGITLCRAVPSNGFIFMTYEFVIRQLG